MRHGHNYFIQRSYCSIASCPGLSVSLFQAKTSLLKDSILSQIRTKKRSPPLFPGYSTTEITTYAKGYATSYTLNSINIIVRFMQFNTFKSLLFSVIDIRGDEELLSQIFSFRFGLLVAFNGSRISIEEEHVVDIVWGVLQ